MFGNNSDVADDPGVGVLLHEAAQGLFDFLTLVVQIEVMFAPRYPFPR